ncbi:hypothetical protein QJQ45_016356 [Haematococcus lacustris]|nr:hypothetical protein QJQ45_016356 [Haematococcus lacustris]
MRGGWGAMAVLPACCKVVERLNRGKPWQGGSFADLNLQARALALGKEYPAMGFKKLRDSEPKAQAQQVVCTKHRPSCCSLKECF